MSGTIRAKDVRLAYKTARPRWNAPSEDDCTSLASILTVQRSLLDGMGRLQDVRSDADGPRRIAKAARVRQALGTILADLPELAEWAALLESRHPDAAARRKPWDTLLAELREETEWSVEWAAVVDSQCADAAARRKVLLAERPAARNKPDDRHAASLAALLTWSSVVGQLWPGLDGRLRRLNPPPWTFAANAVVMPALISWRAANPRRKPPGKPLSPGQPTTKAMQELLRLAGQTVTQGQIAQHFNRNPSVFASLDASRRAGRKSKGKS